MKSVSIHFKATHRIFTSSIMKSVSIHFKATHRIFTSSITSSWSQCHAMPQWYFHIVHNIIMKSLSIFFKTSHGILTIHYITTKSLSSHRLLHHHEVIVDLFQNNTRYPHHPWHHHEVTVITSSTTWSHKVTVDLFQNNTRYPHHPRHHHAVPSHHPPSPWSYCRSLPSKRPLWEFCLHVQNTTHWSSSTIQTSPAQHPTDPYDHPAAKDAAAVFPSLSSHACLALPDNSQPPLRLGAIIVITILFTHCLKVYYCDSNGNIVLKQNKQNNPQKQQQQKNTHPTSTLLHFHSPLIPPNLSPPWTTPTTKWEDVAIQLLW